MAMNELNYPGKGIGYHWRALMSHKFDATLSMYLSIPTHLHVPMGTHNEERQHTPETEAHDQLLLITDLINWTQFQFETIGITPTAWWHELGHKSL